MSITKIKVAINAKSITIFISLGAIATLLPFFIHVQWFTGVIVNAILILSLFMIGTEAAFFIALIPSLMALAGGLLPALLAPMVPFIMLSNVIYVLVIDFFYKRNKNDKNYFLSLALASTIKFLFLYFSISIIGNLLLKAELLTKVAQVLSWPQFFTAISGGLLAWGILKKTKIG